MDQFWQNMPVLYEKAHEVQLKDTLKTNQPNLSKARSYQQKT